MAGAASGPNNRRCWARGPGLAFPSNARAGATRGGAAELQLTLRAAGFVAGVVKRRGASVGCQNGR